MDINQIWTIQMKNSISGGIMLPQTDPFDASVFYVSDGFRSTYSSMRFRKLSIATGEELANVPTKDCTRCTDYVASDGTGVFLLANWNAPSLSVLELQTQRTHRKKIDGCCGIFRTESNTFLIFNYDSILEYSLKDNKLNKITDTEKYTKCVRGKSGRVYLLCVHYSSTATGVNDYKILIYSFAPKPKLEKAIPFPEEIHNSPYSDMNFCLSEDEKWLYLFDNKSIWIYSICEDKILFRHTFPSECIQNVFVEKSLVITSRDLQKGYEVAGWEIEI